MNELRPKLFDVMKGYTKEQLIKDIISGIIVAIIALPLSIALAIASGVGPEQGLYTAIIAGFFISFFGGSRVQIGGPTAAFVVIIYGIVEQYGTDGLIVATILAGIILAIGRITGETAALIYTAGTVPGIPTTKLSGIPIFDMMASGRTLAIHMYALLNEGLYTEQAYATAVVLLVMVLLINALSAFVAKKFTRS